MHKMIEIMMDRVFSFAAVIPYHDYGYLIYKLEQLNKIIEHEEEMSSNFYEMCKSKDMIIKAQKRLIRQLKNEKKSG